MAADTTLLTLTVNGEARTVVFPTHHTLLEVLREECGLTGTKHGCELGECGTCAVLVDGRPIGAVGEVATAVVDALALVAPVAACELDVDALLTGARREMLARPVSRFPASTVDLAFVVDDAIPAAAIQTTLVHAGGDLLEHVALFDVFRSAALGPGKVSLAFTLRFRALDRTLTDDEVSTLRGKCIDAVVSAHGAELRS